MQRYVVSGSLALALCTAACTVNTPAPPDAGSQVTIVQQAPMTVAPTPPPVPQNEVVPPPPVSATPTIWQPGHWRYTGITGRMWDWQSGGYVALPPGATSWVPGQWTQQATGGWVWRDGHWS